MKYQELEQVVLVETVKRRSFETGRVVTVKAGTEGTVMHTYSTANAYVVEFPTRSRRPLLVNVEAHEIAPTRQDAA